MSTFNNFLFIGLPYAALTFFFIGTIYVYRSRKFKFSSLSTEFLEGKKLFWGSVPFHWGIIFLFFGHLIGLLIPSAVIAWNSVPLRLVIIEVAAFAFGISAFIGLINLILRRRINPRINIVTSKMDLILLTLLLIEIFFGLWVAYQFRWGSSWFAAVMAPYITSLFTFSPDIAAVANLPWVIQVHIVLAFIILLIFPFTRLVHLLVYPLHYIWRPYQRVIWNWNRKKVRDANEVWSITDPRNN